MKITKSRTLQLELQEEDIQALSDICELARRYISEHRNVNVDLVQLELGDKRLSEIKEFLQVIFDI